VKASEIRKATRSDLDEIKVLADKHKDELGFVLRAALARSIDRGEVLVAENASGVVGFAEYHHRRDGQTTLYHMAVRPNVRRLNTGRELIKALVKDAREHCKSFIQLKCPAELGANGFYERLGFSRTALEPGRKRQLIVWRLVLR
jgi:N-acetylglutamate synthase-like GNAT family acetyltransferase